MKRLRKWIEDRIRSRLFPYASLFPYFPHHYAAYKLLPTRCSRVLDVGCGDGRWITGLPGEKVGLDVDKHELARAKSACDVVLASAQHFPFRSEVFDLVTFLEVIEHLDNPAQALGEVNRVLKEQGRLVLTTPNLHEPVQILFNLFPSKIKPRTKPFEIHRGGWDFLTMRDLLLYKGFRIEKRGASVLRPFPWSVGKIFANIFPALSYHIAVRARKEPSKNLEASHVIGCGG